MNMNGEIEIKIRGRLDKEWEEIFQGMHLEYEEDTTILTGNLIDGSHLHGVLNTIRDLNLKLISINPLDTKKQP
jgi:hypothetical protein